MGTQTAGAEKIQSKRGDYALALKENNKNLYEDVRLFLDEETEKKKLRKNGKYKKSVERTQKHRNGRKDNPKGWSGKKGVQILY